MNAAFVAVTIVEGPSGFALERGGKPMFTPQKKPLVVPSRALAQKLAAELGGGKPFTAKNMPFSAMAFSAIDVVATHRSRMEEAMLAYAETDLLCYRSETPPLLALQEEGWDPVIAWVQRRYDCRVETTLGIMPVTQSQATLARLRGVLASLDVFPLAAISVLTQSTGSLLLALAVKERELSGAKAFMLSRIDEEYQAELWGEDSVTVARGRELERDILAAEALLQNM